jgi:hypothetical protein
MVSYNVQATVDTTNHLIVAHEVTNIGTDRSQLSGMAEPAHTKIGSEQIDVVADRGYYEGGQIKARGDAGITVTLPKTMTLGAKPTSSASFPMRMRSSVWSEPFCLSRTKNGLSKWRVTLAYIGLETIAPLSDNPLVSLSAVPA